MALCCSYNKSTLRQSSPVEQNHNDAKGEEDGPENCRGIQLKRLEEGQVMFLFNGLTWMQ
jgi:hypothetical protein